MNYMRNPHGHAIRKYIYQLIGNRYSKNEEVIERLIAVMMTKKDVEDFSTLIVDIYESGFLRAVDQYKNEFSKIGYDVKITAEKQPISEEEKIFPDQDISG